MTKFTVFNDLPREAHTRAIPAGTVVYQDNKFISLEVATVVTVCGWQGLDGQRRCKDEKGNHLFWIQGPWRYTPDGRGVDAGYISLAAAGIDQEESEQCNQ